MYTFRLKTNSSLADYVDIILRDHKDGITQSDLKRLYPDITWNTLGALAELGVAADNFTFSRSGISYVDVTPKTTIIKEAAHVDVSAPQRDTEDYEQIQWPDTPIVGDTADYGWFRKPEWYDRMALMVKAGKNISLSGPPGIGKSSAIEYLAAENGKVLVNVSADAGLRRRDLTGNTELVNSHTQFMVAEYTAAAVNGWWVKIDEVNAAEADALMFLNSQIAPPHSVNFYGRSLPVHKDFRCFITYNPGLTGTKPLPESLKDRFFPIKLQFPNRVQLAKMLHANGMPTNEDWTVAIIEYGIKVWEQHLMGRMRYQITPRRLMDAVTLVTIAGSSVWDALEDAVISAVDVDHEVQVLKNVLSTVKQEIEFGRN